MKGILEEPRGKVSDALRPQATPPSLFDANLKDMVEIHQAMFRKLLASHGGESARHLASLFEDVANRYLDISNNLTEPRGHGLITD